MVNSNHVAALEKLVRLADWIKAQPGSFTSADAAIAMGMSGRTVHRYIACLKALDGCLKGEAGVGYMYRKIPLPAFCSTAGGTRGGVESPPHFNGR